MAAASQMSGVQTPYNNINNDNNSSNNLPAGSDPRQANQTNNDSSDSSSKPNLLTKHLNSRYYCLKIYSTQLESLKGDVDKSDDATGFTNKSRIRNYLKEYDPKNFRRRGDARGPADENRR